MEQTTGLISLLITPITECGLAVMLQKVDAAVWLWELCCVRHSYGNYMIFECLWSSEIM